MRAAKAPWRKVAAFMDEAETAVLASMTFPKDHGQSTEAAGIFPPPAIRFARRNLWPASPNEAAITRLVGAILLAQNDAWAVQRSRYMTLESIAPLRDDPLGRLSAVKA